MSVTFMDPDEPNFIWKEINAREMGCIIENELPEISPAQRYDPITLQGRNGELHETFGDFDSYDFPIKSVTIPYKQLQEVKKWLAGRGRLITHNDRDKYRDALCMMSKAIEFENEWGCFYKFDLSFRCQPFRRKVNEQANVFSKGSFDFVDPGDEVACPYFEIQAAGGEFSIRIGDDQLSIKAQRGLVTIDTEVGKIMQEGLPLFSTGSWPHVKPGENKLITTGNLTGGTILNRSVWL